MGAGRNLRLSWVGYETVSAFAFDSSHPRVDGAALGWTEDMVAERLSALEAELTEAGIHVNADLPDAGDRLAEAICSNRSRLDRYCYVGESDDRFRYRIVAEAADNPIRGGQMHVWPAEDRSGAQVAVKLFDRPTDEDTSVLFARLAHTTDFRHPNLTRVVDVFRGTAPVAYPAIDLPSAEYTDIVVVEDWVDGDPLRAALPTMSAPARLTCIAEIASAVGYLHNFRSRDVPFGFAHRDLKVDNIFLKHVDGSAVVMDLALGRNLPPPDDPVTKDRGTEGWLAPEQLRERMLTSTDVTQIRAKPVDVFGVGLLAHFIIAGDRPTASESSTLSMLTRTLSRFGGKNPSECADHISRLLRENPMDRPDDLTRWASELTELSAGGRRARRFSTRQVIASVLVGLAAVSATWLIVSQSMQSESTSSPLPADTSIPNAVVIPIASDQAPTPSATVVDSATSSPSAAAAQVGSSATAARDTETTGAPTASPTPPPLVRTVQPVPSAETLPPVIVPTPTSTPVPAPTFTATPIPAATPTPPPTPTATSAPTATPTPTPTPTATPTPTPTIDEALRCQHNSNNPLTVDLVPLAGSGPLSYTRGSTNWNGAILVVIVVLNVNAKPHHGVSFQAEYFDGVVGQWRATGKWTSHTEPCVVNPNGTMHGFDLPDSTGPTGSLGVWTESPDGSIPPIRFRSIALNEADQQTGIYSDWEPLG